MQYVLLFKKIKSIKELRECKERMSKRVELYNITTLPHMALTEAKSKLEKQEMNRLNLNKQENSKGGMHFR